MNRRALVWFALAALVFQFAIWNARIGNTDTYHQLIATVHLAQTGSLGFAPRELSAVGADDERNVQFVRASNDRWYQVHDPGNKVLMLPASLIARAIGRQPSDDPTPSSTTKVLASGTLALFAMLGTLTAWDAVAVTGSDVIAQDTPYPKQIIETARSTGRTIPLADDRGFDAGVDTKRGPDIAVVYATREAGGPDALGLAGFALLLGLAAWAFVAADRALAERDDYVSDPAGG